MERRDFERIPIKIDTLILDGNILTSGTVLNYSDKGMFISVSRQVNLDNSQ